MELILVRHGLPERIERKAGKADPALSALGRQQAEAVAGWLETEGVGAVYASPMRRARETAEPFSERVRLPIGFEEGVVEFDRHASSYVPMEELKSQDYAAWKAFVDGGYNEGVDIHQFHATVVNALERLIAAHSGERIAVFCHGGVINVWSAHVLGLTPSLFFEPAYTSVHRYLCARTGERNIVSLNETGHLRGLSRPAS